MNHVWLHICQWRSVIVTHIARMKFKAAYIIESTVDAGVS